MFLMELDVNTGHVHRAIQFGDIWDEEATAVAADMLDGAVYVGGTTSDVFGGDCVQISPGDGLNCGGASDIVLLRFQRKAYANGDDMRHPDFCDPLMNPCPMGYNLSEWKESFKMVWAVRMGDAGMDVVRSILTDFKGYLYATGWTEEMQARVCAENSTCNGTDGFVLRFDPSIVSDQRGISWFHTFGSNVRPTDSSGSALAVSSDKPQDMLIVPTEKCSKDVEMECTVAADGDTEMLILINTDGNLAECSALGGDLRCGKGDVSIVKFNLDGTLIWSTLAGSEENDHGSALVYSHFGAPLSVGFSEVTRTLCELGTICEAMAPDRGVWTDVDTSLISFYDVVCLPGSMVATHGRGCWRCPPGMYSNDGNECLPCPEGSQCRESGVGSGMIANGSNRPVIRLGYQRTTTFTENPDFATLRNNVCYPNVRMQMPCAGQVLLNSTHTKDTCIEGYLDGSPLCGTCDVGYIRFHGLCMPCSGGPGPAWILSGQGVLIFSVACFSLYYATRLLAGMFCVRVSIFVRMWRWAVWLAGIALAEICKRATFVLQQLRSLKRAIVFVSCCLCNYFSAQKKVHVAKDAYDEEAVKAQIRANQRKSSAPTKEDKKLAELARRKATIGTTPLWLGRREYKVRDKRGVRKRHMSAKECFREAMAPEVEKRRPDLVGDEVKMFAELNAKWRWLTPDQKKLWDKKSEEDEVRLWEEYQELKKQNLAQGVRDARGAIVGTSGASGEGLGQLDRKRAKLEEQRKKKQKHKRRCEDCGKRAPLPNMGRAGDKIARWCEKCAKVGHPDAVDCVALFGEVLDDKSSSSSSSSEYEYESDYGEASENESSSDEYASSEGESKDKQEKIRRAKSRDSLGSRQGVKSRKAKLSTTKESKESLTPMERRLRYGKVKKKQRGLSKEEKMRIRATVNTSRREAGLKRRDEIVGHLKIIVGHIQIINAMTHAMYVPWSEMTWNFLVFFDFIDAHVSYISVSGCTVSALDRPLPELALVVIFSPLAIVALVKLVLALLPLKDYFIDTVWNRKEYLMQKYSMKRGSNTAFERRHLQRKIASRREFAAVNLFAFLMMLTFLPVSRMALQMLQCRPYDEIYLLASDPRFECNEDNLTLVAVSCSLCSVIYMIGTPLFVYNILVWKSEELRVERMWSRYRLIKRQLRFLHGEYREGFYMFEVFEMARKLISAVIIQQIIENSSEQIILAIILTMTAFCYVGMAQPYRTKPLGFHACLALSVQILTLIIGLHARDNKPRSDAQEALKDWLLISANVLIIVIGIIFAGLKATNVNARVSIGDECFKATDLVHHLGGSIYTEMPKRVQRMYSVATLTPIRSIEVLYTTGIAAELTETRAKMKYEENRLADYRGDGLDATKEAIGVLVGKVGASRNHIRKADKTNAMLHQRGALLWKEIKALKGTPISPTRNAKEEAKGQKAKHGKNTKKNKAKTRRT
jgi:hypothetical protein